MSDSLISATALDLSYGHGKLLDEANLAIHAGDRVGLVGRNGCGKSSFLRILAGGEDPDGGHVSRRQGLVSGFLPQEFELEETRTVEENVRAGAAELVKAIRRFESGEKLTPREQERLQATIEHADGWNLENRMATLMRRLDCPPPDRTVSQLSGGEKRRVGLARALVARPDFLILDEPTNHLDASAIEWLEEYLAELPGACLFVTHDRYFLDRVANRVVELSGGTFYSHEGGYGDYLEAREQRRESEAAVEEKRKRFLRREIEWVRAGVQARRTKQQSRLDQFYAVQAEEGPAEEWSPEMIVPPAPPLGNIVVNLEEVCLYAGDRPLVLGLDLEFRPGECVGIIGPNGVGKTTLLRAVLGERQPDSGRIKIGRRTEFNYADQTRLVLNEENSIFEEVSEGREMMRFGAETVSVRSYLKRFLFSDDRIQGRIAQLSGGEKNRVLLAKILKRGGNFLILDEPTNDLDLESLRALEESLIHFTGTALVVSHDRYFLDRVCDRLIAFEGDGRLSVNEGNYSYYREKRRDGGAGRSRPAAAISSPGAKGSGSSPSKRDAPPKLKWKEERELESMEDCILEAEAALADVEERLADPRFFVDEPEEAARLAQGLDERKAAIHGLYDRWEELEAIRATWESWKAENG